MYSHRLVSLLKFYDFCGFNTQYSTSAKYHRQSRIIFSVHIFIAFALFLSIFYILSIFKSSLKPLEALSEISVYSICLITYCSILIESYIHQKNQRHFWQLYENINRDKQTIIKLRFHLGKILIYFLSNLSNVIGFILEGNFEIIVFIVYFYLSNVGHLRIFYYSFCLELIECQLKAIKIEMIDQNRTKIDGLKWTRNVYRIIYEMSEEMNETFDWLHSFVVMFCFHYILNDLNWAYLHFYELSSIHPYCKSISNIIGNLISERFFLTFQFMY